MTTLIVGATFTSQRTFTAEMVQAFVSISGDAGAHHVQPDAHGRVLVHGLLVASLATEIGGRLNYLARTMDFEFRRPVYSGETISCRMRIDEAHVDDKGTHLRLAGDATNGDGVIVMRMKSHGLVRSH